MTREVRAGLAIVGASAAGLAAALAAARSGADVLLLESRAAVGEPPAPAIVGFDLLWPAAIAPPRASVRRRLAGVRLRASDGRGPVVDAPLTLFDRARLDAHLAHAAERAGARLLTGVRGLRARDDGSLAAEGLEVRPRVTLFADGARTQATRFLAPTRAPGDIAYGAVLGFEAPGDADRLAITLGPHAPGGRSQLNPLGAGRWSHWTFFRGDPALAEPLARKALAIDARLAGWEEPKAEFLGVAADPVYTLPGDLVRGRVMVAGGAAGQGGLEVGLSSGWMAGEAAARHLADGSPLRAYERAWRARYQKGYERLRAVTALLGRLTDGETRALLGAWDGARLPARLSARPLLARPRGVLVGAAAAFAAWARA